jgi:spore germination cell wall hydrolase CwlJ-like protein
MGFKVNYHPELIAFLGVLFLSTTPLSVNANIPQQKDPIGDILQQSYIQSQQPIETQKPIEPNPKDVKCVAEAVYFESKNEPIKGQKAVAHVILNRTKNPKFPSTVCRVVSQKTDSGCQFSYKCTNKALVMKNEKDYQTAKEVAKEVLMGENDITRGAIYFHNNHVKPAWAKLSNLTMTVGNHKFYKG